jgi:hypothetical protein
MTRRRLDEAGRTRRLEGIARIEGMLERGTWPTGIPITERERAGLRWTVDAMRRELREAIAS